jgi:hypothetical protein
VSNPLLARFLVMGVASASSGAHEGCENFEKAASVDSKYEKKTDKLSSANETVEMHDSDSLFPGSILINQLIMVLFHQSNPFSGFSEHLRAAKSHHCLLIMIL